MSKKLNFFGLGNKVFSYRIEIEKKHSILINEENKRFLLDTGSPVSMAYEPFTFCGQEHQPHGTMLLNSIRELSGLDVAGVIGLDLLKKGGGHVLIDYPNQKIHISNRAFNIQGYASHMHTMLGMAVGFDALFKEIPARCILDTGAFISYVKPYMVKDLKPVRHEMDFHPFVGEFEVPIYENLVFTFGDKNVPVTCGLLPQESALAFAASKVGDAILGYDLLQSHQVEIDFKNKVLTIN